MNKPRGRAACDGWSWSGAAGVTKDRQPSIDVGTTSWVI